LYLIRCGMIERSELPHLFLLVVPEIALEPFDVAVAFEATSMALQLLAVEKHGLCNQCAISDCSSRVSLTDDVIVAVPVPAASAR
jgi:hypothetical protein